MSKHDDLQRMINAHPIEQARPMLNPQAIRAAEALAQQAAGSGISPRTLEIAAAALAQEQARAIKSTEISELARRLAEPYHHRPSVLDTPFPILRRR